MRRLFACKDQPAADIIVDKNGHASLKGMRLI